LWSTSFALFHHVLIITINNLLCHDFHQYATSNALDYVMFGKHVLI
jgi:hypothetical protein